MKRFRIACIVRLAELAVVWIDVRCNTADTISNRIWPFEDGYSTLI